jgi:hypothetical protein
VLADEGGIEEGRDSVKIASFIDADRRALLSAQDSTTSIGSSSDDSAIMLYRDNDGSETAAVLELTLQHGRMVVAQQLASSHAASCRQLGAVAHRKHAALIEALSSSAALA